MRKSMSHVTEFLGRQVLSFNERQLGECDSWLSAQLPSLDPPPPPPCPEWDERTKHPSYSSPSSPPLHFQYDQAAFSFPPLRLRLPSSLFWQCPKLKQWLIKSLWPARTYTQRERDREKGTDRPTDRSTNERGTRWVWSVGRIDLSGKLSPSTPPKPKRTNSFFVVHYDHCMATSHKSTCSLIRAAPRMARGSLVHHARF